MNEPLISVIIPAYNAENTIGKIVKSVLEQPHKNIELIVVDDGSKDGTVDVLNALKDRRMKIVRQKNGGVSAARNTGIENAKGEYVMFFDADDDIEQSMIPDMAAAMGAHGVDVVVCGNKMNDKRTMPAFSGEIKDGLREHVLQSILRGGLLYSPWNKIYKMSIIKKNNLRFASEMRFGEDLVFNLGYFEYVKSICYLQKALYIYARSESGASFTSAAFSGDRRLMYRAVKRFVGKARGAKANVLMLAIRARWGLSVEKARIKKRMHG